jgi:transposase
VRQCPARSGAFLNEATRLSSRLSRNTPRASAAAIARKHGIGTGQLYAWRRQLLKRQLVETPRFARVEVAVGAPRLTGPIASSVSGTAGTIEITLADGTSVRVSADVDELALRRVLGVLRE